MAVTGNKQRWLMKPMFILTASMDRKDRKSTRHLFWDLHGFSELSTWKFEMCYCLHYTKSKMWAMWGEGSAVQMFPMWVRNWFQSPRISIKNYEFREMYLQSQICANRTIHRNDWIDSIVKLSHFTWKYISKRNKEISKC